MASAADVVRDFVQAFITAWPTADAALAASFFSEDAEYHNMPLAPVFGRPAIESTLAEFMQMGGTVAVDMFNMVADGPIVMTERVDYFIGPDTTLTMPVMGVFEVHDGLITAWRDYFDLGQFTAQSADAG